MASTSAVSNVGSSSWIWDFYNSFCNQIYQKVNGIAGPILRDGMYLPHNTEEKFSKSTLQDCRDIFDPNVQDPTKPGKAAVLHQYTIERKEISVPIRGKTYLLKITIIAKKNAVNLHTVFRVGGNDEKHPEIADRKNYPLMEAAERLKNSGDVSGSLQIVNFSFYGHFVVENREKKPWLPDEVQEIGKVFFSLVSELRRNHRIVADTLWCHSLGSVVLEALPLIQPPDLPKTIVLDRAFTSTLKVSILYHPVKAFVLTSLARFGWTADPESQLLEYMKGLKPHELQGRKLRSITVEHDVYFSGERGFDPKFIPALQVMGIQAQHQKYKPNQLIRAEAHHALFLDMLPRKETKTKKTNAAEDLIRALL